MFAMKILADENKLVFANGDKQEIEKGMDLILENIQPGLVEDVDENDNPVYIHTSGEEMIDSIDSIVAEYESQLDDLAGTPEHEEMYLRLGVELGLVLQARKLIDEFLHSS